MTRLRKLLPKNCYQLYANVTKRISDEEILVAEKIVEELIKCQEKNALTAARS